MAQRPNWDEYFLKLAMLASERATCPRMHCGAVLVKNKNVIATGYNGSIPGDEHCEDVGCLLVDNHCVRTVHAEMNAIVQAARRGHTVDGATAYVTNMPCTTCAKSLITRSLGGSSAITLMVRGREFGASMRKRASAALDMRADSDSMIIRPSPAQRRAWRSSLLWQRP